MAGHGDGVAVGVDFSRQRWITGLSGQVFWSLSNDQKTRLGTDLLAIEQREVRLKIYCHSKRMSRILAAINFAILTDATMIAFRTGNLG